MKIIQTSRNIEKFTGDMVACFVHQQDKKKPLCSHKYIQNQIDLAFQAGDFGGKEGETLMFYPPDKK